MFTHWRLEQIFAAEEAVDFLTLDVVISNEQERNPLWIRGMLNPGIIHPLVTRYSTRRPIGSVFVSRADTTRFAGTKNFPSSLARSGKPCIRFRKDGNAVINSTDSDLFFPCLHVNEGLGLNSRISMHEFSHRKFESDLIQQGPGCCPELKSSLKHIFWTHGISE